MKKVSIMDVAKAANVSVTTVSKALNDYSDISAKTKQKIQIIAKEMSYVPNAKARSLGGITEKTIALLISSLKKTDESGLVFGLISSIYNYCNLKNYEFILLATDSANQKKMTYLQMCQHKGIDGVVVMGLTLDDPYCSEIIKSPIPCALIDIDIPFENENVCSVSIDNQRASQQAVLYLIEHGKKKIAMFNGKNTADVCGERHLGYMRALIQHNMPIESELLVYTDFSTEDAYKKAKAFFKKHNKVDAVFCASDLIAFGVIKAAKEFEIKIPEQLAVIGFDNILASEHFAGGLTTINQNPYEIGTKAAKAIVNIIEKKQQDKKITVNYEFILRKTT